MKIRIVSDLHLEFGDLELEHLETDIDSVLILAGDIHVGTKAWKWIEPLLDRFKHTIYILGNHEYYNRNYDLLPQEWKDITHPKFSFLEDDYVVIDDIEFFGATLWTNMNNGDWVTCKKMDGYLNDFRMITHNGLPLRAEETARTHARSLKEMQKRLLSTEANKFVCVTHHLPHKLSVHKRFESSPVNPAFMSNLEEMFDKDITLWIHGHTHDSFDYVLNNTRVVCNPRGYAGHELNSSFDNKLVVEI